MKTNVSGKTKTLLFCILFIFELPGASFAQKDYKHYSKVFGREKPYRIFLPDDYSKSDKKYPVIYYFHGNTGTHELEREGLTEHVTKNSVILVAWNGRSVDSDMRPYNIGNHSNIKYQVQFKDYFLELAGHIDSTYRTINDRIGRAVIGHSMGGIMSFFLAGKYPDLVGAAANSKGSPEFFIGYPDNHSLYHVRYMFKNLHGVKLRFTNSTTGELVNLNNEVNRGALNELGLNYEYQVYEGGHDLKDSEFFDAFNFVVAAFKNPLSKPIRWNHSDLYSDFNVWGYEVKSNKTVPGFIDLRGVTKGGFGVTTKKWEPDGDPIPGVEIKIKTPAVYTPNTAYSLLDYNKTRDSKTITEVKTDSEGKISYSVNQENHLIGISKKGDPAEIVFAQYLIDGKSAFLEQNKECKLKVRFLNRGGSDAENLNVKLSTSNEGVVVSNHVITVKKIPAGELVWQETELIITSNNKPITDGSPFKIRFNLEITDKNNRVWNDEFDVPVFYNVPEFTNIGIDDGDSEIFGSGNGNNIAEPGEDILIYEITNGSHRTRLYYDDKYVDEERLYDEIQPDKWGDGYSLSSIIHIADNCPPGHRIKFLACYEIKDWKAIKRNVAWGTFTITVSDNSDK